MIVIDQKKELAINLDKIDYIEIDRDRSEIWTDNYKLGKYASECIDWVFDDLTRKWGGACQVYIMPEEEKLCGI